MIRSLLNFRTSRRGGLFKIDIEKPPNWMKIAAPAYFGWTLPGRVAMPPKAKVRWRIVFALIDWPQAHFAALQPVEGAPPEASAPCFRPLPMPMPPPPLPLLAPPQDCTGRPQEACSARPNQICYRRPTCIPQLQIRGLPLDWIIITLHEQSAECSQFNQVQDIVWQESSRSVRLIAATSKIDR